MGPALLFVSHLIFGGRAPGHIFSESFVLGLRHQPPLRSEKRVCGRTAERRIAVSPDFVVPTPPPKRV